MEKSEVNVNEINVRDIKQSYSGRSGCMCGCRGHYSVIASAIKANLTRMKKLAAAGAKVYLEKGCCYYTENNGRIFALYLTD